MKMIDSGCVDNILQNIADVECFASHCSKLSAKEKEDVASGVVTLRNGEQFNFNEDHSIDWSFRFKLDSATTNLYFYSLHYVGSLCLEYINTDDKKFLEMAIGISRSYFHFISNPHNRRVAETNREGGSRDHGTVIRVSCLCMLLKIIVESNDYYEFTRDIARYIIDCGYWLEEDQNYRTNNHGLMSDVCLAQIGVVVGQETAIGKRFVDKSRWRIAELILGAFCSEGLANENTIGYHRYNLIKYKEAVELFKCWGLYSGKFADVAYNVIDKAEFALSVCVWHDGSIPPIGDWPIHPTNCVSRDMPYLFPESGFAVIKNEDLYISIICGHRGTAHKHVDDTSITIRYRGVDVVIDCGNFSFDRTSPYRQCLESSYGHSGCFVDSIDGLLTSQYLALIPEGRFLEWNETTSGVSVVVELAFKGVNVAITRKIEVVWPATITIEDVVTAGSPELLIVARQGWIFGKDISRSYCHGHDYSIHFPGDTVSATVEFNDFSHDDELTFHRGLISPVARGWCSEKDGEIEPTLELSHYKSGNSMRFLTTVSLSSNITA